MRIALVGPAHPYKGGGAQHTTELAHRLTAAGHDVVIESWHAQYPARLYPGQQTIEVPEGEPYPRTRRRLAWYRPDGWLAEGRRLRSADLVVFALLTPVQVPAYLAMLAALRRSPKHPRTAVICHNVLPHERLPGDVALTRALLSRVDTVIVHSAEQAAQARSAGPGRPDHGGADASASAGRRVRFPPGEFRTGSGNRPAAVPAAVLRHRPPLQGPGRAAACPGPGPGAAHAPRSRASSGAARPTPSS